MKDKVDKLVREASEAMSAVSTSSELDEIRVRYLGKKGSVTTLLKSMGQLPPEDRPVAGKLVNKARKEVESSLKDRKVQIAESESARNQEEQKSDVTLPGIFYSRGHRHPVNLVMDEIIEIFLGMGFGVRRGSEIESDYYNFEALNIPKNHPARDMQDTFYIDDDTVLRTHTSPVQIRVMEKEPPPLRIISPGKVYRVDYDVTHSPMFHQVEGFMVDEGITFGDLKGVLLHFATQFFGKSIQARFRPSFFPFTEPSAEVDISCVMCNAEGCRVCSNTGWLEILGSGMIHPEVFRHVGYDSDKFSGFAFGIGIERATMLRYGIDDIRLFYENDMRFLEQF